MSTLAFADQIVPAGVQNGTNAVFTLPQAPDPPESLNLTLGGLRMKAGADYALSGVTIMYLAGFPLADDVQLASYRYTRTDTTTPILPAGATPNGTLIKAALRKAGVTLSPGRGPSPDQYAEAVGEENRMIGSWNCNPLNIFTSRIDLYDTIANQQSYTIGVDPTGSHTADWDAPRPQEIVRANFLLPTGADPIHKVRKALKIWLDKDWANINFQAVYTYPEGLYFDGGCDPASGFGRIYFRPIPNGIYQIELYTWQALPRFSSLEDSVILPPGYEAAIVNNLAVGLASMPWPVKVPMDPQVRIDARISLNAIQQMNVTVPRLKSDRELAGGRGGFQWWSGTSE